VRSTPKVLVAMLLMCGAGLVVLASVRARSLSGPATVSNGLPAFRNPALPLQQRIDDLISRLTLQEKISLVQDTTPAIPRLGIAAYDYGDEALHGVVRPGTATVFPQAIGLAATWDPALVRKMADDISDEGRAKYNWYAGRLKIPYSGLLTFWAPVVNLAHDPRWGRTQETYGEDPYLAGRLGVAYVEGLQGNDPKYLKAIATPKAFVAYSQEAGRFSTNAVISESQLRDYYLPPFRDCVVEGRAESVMSAYNAINGIPCTANRWLLTDVLRGEWGFKGYVVSDCGAVANLFTAYHDIKSEEDAAAAALNAGLDLECGHLFKGHLLAAVQLGLVSERTLNRAVADVLRGRFLLGLFDPPNQVPFTRIPASDNGSPQHVALARQLARESIVLLKNDKVDSRPLLPLDPACVHSIAVVGPNAAVCRFGDYSGNPANPAVSPLAGIRARAGAKIAVKLIPWSMGLSPIPSEDLSTGKGRQGLLGEYFDNDRLEDKPSAERIDQDVHFKEWGYTTPVNSLLGPQYSVRWTGRLTPPVTGDYELGVKAGGQARLYLDGQELVEGLTGTVTKSVSLQAGRSYSVRLEYLHHKNSDRGIRLVWKPPDEGFQQIRQSDVVIAVLGLSTDIETEGKDRTTLALPTEQQKFIRQVVRANPRTIVVLENGSAVAINWIQEHVPAILEAWYPGEEGGHAIADVLFGDYNPAGRLPLTFYASAAQLPPIGDYDITKGRTYMYLDRPPLYPFGYGLSYTKFRYENLRLSPKETNARGVVRASVDIGNVGKRDGDEVVQVYVREEKRGDQQPHLQLKAFERFHLRSGEWRTITLALPIAAWARWDTREKSFIVAPGLYDVWVGASSADIRLRGQVTVSGVGARIPD
jgi:beta-glucosidase